MQEQQEEVRLERDAAGDAGAREDGAPQRDDVDGVGLEARHVEGDEERAGRDR